MKETNVIQKLPVNFIESDASYFWLDDDGILVIVNKPVTLHTKAHAEAGVIIATEISAGIPRPFLIDMADVKSMSRDAREIYAKVSAERAKAVALITKSSMSRIIGNFFLSFNKLPVPTRLFSDPDAARKWLSDYV